MAAPWEGSAAALKSERFERGQLKQTARVVETRGKGQTAGAGEVTLPERPRIPLTPSSAASVTTPAGETTSISNGAHGGELATRGRQGRSSGLVRVSRTASQWWERGR